MSLETTSAGELNYVRDDANIAPLRKWTYCWRVQPGRTCSKKNYNGHKFMTRANHQVSGPWPCSSLERDGLHVTFLLKIYHMMMTTTTSEIVYCSESNQWCLYNPCGYKTDEDDDFLIKRESWKNIFYGEELLGLHPLILNFPFLLTGY